MKRDIVITSNYCLAPLFLQRGVHDEQELPAAQAERGTDMIVRVVGEPDRRARSEATDVHAQINFAAGGTRTADDAPQPDLEDVAPIMTIRVPCEPTLSDQKDQPLSRGAMTVGVGPPKQRARDSVADPLAISVGISPEMAWVQPGEHEEGDTFEDAVERQKRETAGPTLAERARHEAR